MGTIRPRPAPIYYTRLLNALDASDASDASNATTGQMGVTIMSHDLILVSRVLDMSFEPLLSTDDMDIKTIKTIKLCAL